MLECIDTEGTNLSMDPLELERRRGDILQQIRRYQSRLDDAGRKLSSTRNEISGVTKELNDCNERIHDCRDQIRKLERDIEESLNILDAINRGSLCFDEAITHRHFKVAAVGEFSTTVRFADAYSTKLHGMLTGVQHAQAVDNINQVKQNVYNRLDDLQDQIDEIRHTIRTLEQRTTELSNKRRVLEANISDLSSECTWCRGEINRLNNELRYLEMTSVI
jgi:peptidoglycan hydrolase CwlO-like protein